jgi:hypothetical protein
MLSAEMIAKLFDPMGTPLNIAWIVCIAQWYQAFLVVIAIW